MVSNNKEQIDDLIHFLSYSDICLIDNKVEHCIIFLYKITKISLPVFVIMLPEILIRATGLLAGWKENKYSKEHHAIVQSGILSIIRIIERMEDDDIPIDHTIYSMFKNLINIVTKYILDIPDIQDNKVDSSGSSGSREYLIKRKKEIYYKRKIHILASICLQQLKSM
jgi:hypothetical protein